MMYNYCDEFPDEWSEGAMAEVLCDFFPRKISVDQGFYENVESILRPFFLFLDLKHLTVLLKKSCKVMIKKSKDSSNWGMAKQFVISAMDSGVYLEDKEAMYNFIDEYNQNGKVIVEEDGARRLSRKVDRNDPCPCGSGENIRNVSGNENENL